MLDWSKAPLTATFESVAYESRSADRFRYRLVGLDNDWSTSAGGQVTFSTLPPGRYRLEVMTVNDRLDRRSPVAALALEVAAPWWRTPTFYAACVLAIAALAWSAHAWRLRAHTRRRRVLERLVAERTRELEESREATRMLGVHNARALEDERTRVARELHEEMGQQLAALGMEVSVLRLRVRSGTALDEGPLADLLSRVNDVVAGIRRVVTQLRPLALDGGLAAAVDWLAADFERTSDIPCGVDITARAQSLSKGAASMVFRIVQESLTNVRRHASATEVTIRLQAAGEDWELVVRDDGVGFDASDLRTGYGVLGMEERARALGGSLDVESAAGAGTTVRLRFRSGETTRA
jgi:signal transduction histidine kinase